LAAKAATERGLIPAKMLPIENDIKESYRRRSTIEEKQGTNQVPLKGDIPNFLAMNDVQFKQFTEMLGSYRFYFKSFLEIQAYHSYRDASSKASLLRKAQSDSGKSSNVYGRKLTEFRIDLFEHAQLIQPKLLHLFYQFMAYLNNPPTLSSFDVQDRPYVFAVSPKKIDSVNPTDLMELLDEGFKLIPSKPISFRSPIESSGIHYQPHETLGLTYFPFNKHFRQFLARPLPAMFFPPGFQGGNRVSPGNSVSILGHMNSVSRSLPLDPFSFWEIGKTDNKDKSKLKKLVKSGRFKVQVMGLGLDHPKSEPDLVSGNLKGAGISGSIEAKVKSTYGGRSTKDEHGGVELEGNWNEDVCNPNYIKIRPGSRFYVKKGVFVKSKFPMSGSGLLARTEKGRKEDEQWQRDSLKMFRRNTPKKEVIENLDGLLSEEESVPSPAPSEEKEVDVANILKG
jgi:hypothetical protein